MRDDDSEMADRLRATRLALGYQKAADFCKAIHVSPSVYSPLEKGKRAIPLSVAMNIKREFGVPLDWTLAGDRAFIPPELRKKLNSAA